MNIKKAIFTICAKNYLAQALTLRDSILKYNPEIDFYLFLADEKTDDISDVNVVELDDSWIHDWKRMAFKYNVIEFATSIKPFCFNKLFQEGYDKVLYLDPDIFVTDSLESIYNDLDSFSMVITPHYNHIETEYTGSVTEEELLFVGIYNLGFGAIKNNLIGKQIIEWWKNRLFNKCYADKEDSLHVDQRWIDFLPGFFPNDILISHHAGINIAIWNLHERKLIVKDNKYLIEDLRTKVQYPLLFFHFSGFDPYNRTVINRRHSKYNIEVFPSFIPIINEYSELVNKNKYDLFSKLSYSFNNFDNGDAIIPLHRRLFRVYLEKNEIMNFDAFSSKELFYKILKSKRLILTDKTANYNLGIVKEKKVNLEKIDKIFNNLIKLFIFIFGIKRYYFLIKYIRMKTRLESHDFFLDDIKK
ncbi:glycosyltransferase [Chryseobacterium sp. RG1]|uniref:Glycosyltransferase n=1 Tax=Chryseobacterium tagetis TaxID=2801334 RepID=A0ABS8A5T1_9FLAO|nr:glycosyltransferase [Chryseobacterium tagetis]MCA6069130.1 glycosyltransferase [Chryseobacterium tagetis]